MYLQFVDKMVTYDTFMNDLAARLADKLQQQRNDPEIMSQRKAWQTFGRANVERWLRQGKLHPCKRPGKVEYKVSELRLLQSVKQDYFK